MFIKSNRVWIAGDFIPAVIEISEGKIKGIYAADDRTVDVDYGNRRIVPGFIDIHCHGAYGYDTTTLNLKDSRNGQRESHMKVLLVSSPQQLQN